MTIEEIEIQLALGSLTDDMKVDLAKNSRTSKRILRVLSKDKDWFIRWSVSYNPNTPKKILEVLAKDEDKHVRYGTVDNPSTLKLVDSEMTIKEFEIQLALGSMSNGMKVDLAKNPNTSLEILTILSKDENSAVRHWVADHPNVPVKILVGFVKDEDWCVRCRVADHPNTPTEILVKLSKDENHNVRYWVAGNPNTPKEVKEMLDEYLKKDDPLGAFVEE